MRLESKTNEIFHRDYKLRVTGDDFLFDSSLTVK